MGKEPSRKRKKVHRLNIVMHPTYLMNRKVVNVAGTYSNGDEW
jgi:hypothetical protein